MVTRRVGDVDYEVARSDRGENKQVYHINLLKRWNDAVPVAFASTLPEREEFGPEVPASGPALQLPGRAQAWGADGHGTLPLLFRGGGVSWRPDVPLACVGRWGCVGGRAASCLQGEYGQVGSAPDRLGGLGLIAGTCSQSGQSGSVYLCACFVLW